MQIFVILSIRLFDFTINIILYIIFINLSFNILSNISLYFFINNINYLSVILNIILYVNDNNV
jgi:hypothetical protein